MLEIETGSLSGVGGGTENLSGVSHLLPFSEVVLEVYLGLSVLVGGFEVSSRGVLALKGLPSSEFRNGIDTVTVVPCPGSVLITILPSLSLTNLAATASPRPIEDLSVSRHTGPSTS